MRGVGRKIVGRQDRRPPDRDVRQRGGAHRLSMPLSLPIGIGITRDGTSELQFSSVADGIRPCKSSRRFTSKRRGPYEASSHRLCIAADERRGTVRTVESASKDCGGGRSQQPWWDSKRGWNSPGR